MAEATAESVESFGAPIEHGTAPGAGAQIPYPCGWRRVLAVIVLLSSSGGMALMFTALGPVLPIMAAHYGAGGHGALLAQLVMTAPAIGVILGGALGGFLVERAGIRAVLYTALALYAVAGAAGLVLEDIRALLASRFLLGMAVASISTCVVLLLGQWFQGEARARMLGYQQACAGAFSVATLLISGALGQWGGWRAPFGLYFFSLVVLAFALASIPAPERSAWEARGGAARAPGQFGRLASLWPIYLFTVFLFVTYFMSSIQLTFLLAAAGAKSPVVRSLIIAIGVFGGAMAGVAYGRIYARLDVRGTRLLLLGLMGVGLVVIGISHSLPLIGFGTALVGFGGGMAAPFSAGRLLARAPLEIRGRALGLMYTALYTADFLNPIVVAPMRSLAGIQGAFLIMAAIVALVFAATWRALPAMGEQAALTDKSL